MSTNVPCTYVCTYLTAFFDIMLYFLVRNEAKSAFSEEGGLQNTCSVTSVYSRDTWTWRSKDWKCTMCARARVCVCLCVCACVRVCVCACMCMCVCAWAVSAGSLTSPLHWEDCKEEKVLSEGWVVTSSLKWTKLMKQFSYNSFTLYNHTQCSIHVHTYVYCAYSTIL